MTSAQLCLSTVRDAIAVAHQAQAEIASSVRNDFDRMAINDALAHLERALAELKCFESSAPRRSRPRPPRSGPAATP
jgi:hypothetical protein